MARAVTSRSAGEPQSLQVPSGSTRVWSHASNSGWRFVRWSGDLSGSSARQTLTMNGNKTVTAHWERIPATTYTLRGIADPANGSGGYVEISGGTSVTAGTKRFNQGVRATVEARSNSGWRFVRWSGDLSGSSARQTLTMNGNKTVTAHWERIPATTYTLRGIRRPRQWLGRLRRDQRGNLSHCGYQAVQPGCTSDRRSALQLRLALCPLVRRSERLQRPPDLDHEQQ